jgi:hypothetical protein
MMVAIMGVIIGALLGALVGTFFSVKAEFYLAGAVMLIAALKVCVFNPPGT